MPLGVGKSVCKIEHANKQTNKKDLNMFVKKTHTLVTSRCCLQNKLLKKSAKFFSLKTFRVI